ncbi:hypothetical protein EON81_14890 [bacterium]|nr:MAG: hypothetical protein EON81_14890 [bacterium]
MEQVLQGVPIHLSAPGESVMISRQGDAIRIVFSVVSHDRALCNFPAEDLKNALAEVRAGNLE